MSCAGKVCRLPEATDAAVVRRVYSPRPGGLSSVRPVFLFSRHPHLDREWPFVSQRIMVRLSELGEVRVLSAASKEPLHRQTDLSEVCGLAWFGGALTPECVA